MAQFIEVTHKSTASSKFLININSIQSVEAEANGTGTSLKYFNTVHSATQAIVVRETYDDIKKALLQ